MINIIHAIVLSTHVAVLVLSLLAVTQGLLWLDSAVAMMLSLGSWLCVVLPGAIVFYNLLTGLERTSIVLDPPLDVLSLNLPIMDDQLTPPESIYPTRFNLNAGTMFSISCTFTHMDNTFTVSFYKDGMVVSEASLVDITLTEEEVGVSPDIQKTLTLAFSNFQPVHDGLYYCFAITNDASEELPSELYLYGSGEDCLHV